MKAVLLAAGEGTRLRPLTLTTPKCMVPINGKPLLDYWLDMLVPCEEIDEIFINVSYLKEQVLAHIQSKWSLCNKITLWHEDKLLGTAGTLKANYADLKDCDVMVVHADNLSAFSLDEFLASYRNRAEYIAATMMLFETDKPSQCGIVELDDKCTVIKMHEKVKNPPGNLANGAVYIFSAKVIELIKKQDGNDLSNNIIPHLYGKITTWVNKVYHRDIGTLESLRIAQNFLLETSKPS